jgi:hypothetical protein
VDDRLLLDLWKACLLGNPNMTKKEFERWAHKNYPRVTKHRSIIRKLDRMLRAQKKIAGPQAVDSMDRGLSDGERPALGQDITPSPAARELLTPAELSKIFEGPPVRLRKPKEE